MLQVNRTPGKDVDEVSYHGDTVEKAIGNSHVAVCYRNRWCVVVVMMMMVMMMMMMMMMMMIITIIITTAPSILNKPLPTNAPPPPH